MNLAIKQFKDKLIQLMNESQIPIEVKRLVLLELMVEVNRICEIELNNELKTESEVVEDGNNSTSR